MKNTGHRIWRTEDGRYVPDGHPDSAFQAFTPKDRVPDEILKEAYPQETKPRRARTK